MYSKEAPSGAVDMLFFDPNTDLLRAFRSIPPGKQEAGVAITEYWINGYETIDGIKIPTELAVYGVGFSYELTYKKVRLNASTTGEFDPPIGF